METDHLHASTATAAVMIDVIAAMTRSQRPAATSATYLHHQR
jgi:hypothetical protein